VHPDTNPHVARLTRGARPPSLRVTLWLAFGLGLVILAISLWAVPRVPQTLALLNVLRGLGWGLHLATPVVVAAVAGLITGRDASSEAYRLVRQTPLSERDIALGYVFAALFRLRLLLALVVATMPAIVVGAFGGVFTRFALTRGSGGGLVCMGGPCSTGISALTYTLGWSLCLVATAVGLWGANLLGAAAGVAAGLRLRKPLLAAVLSPLALMPPGLYFMAVVVLFGSIAMLPLITATTALRVVVMTVVLIALPPYLLALTALEIAERHA
jgi:hypothetical protein